MLIISLFWANTFRNFSTRMQLKFSRTFSCPLPSCPMFLRNKFFMVIFIIIEHFGQSSFYLVPICFKIWQQNLPLKCCVFLPDVCQLRSRCSFTSLNLQCFSPNCSKVSMECDWNGKISQNAQSFGVFKKTMRLSKKIELFRNRWRWQICCKMRIKSYSFLKLSFWPQLWGFFGKKNQKILNVGKNLWKRKVFSEKKNLFIFLRAFFTKTGRQKICRWFAGRFDQNLFKYLRKHAQIFLFSFLISV